MADFMATVDEVGDTTPEPYCGNVKYLSVEEQE
jgi:hypothetical protein